MPPIPIYSNSPINAAKAAGISPQTTEKEQTVQSAPSDSTSPSTTVTSQGYPPAQPGASPFLPAPTGFSSAQGQYPPPQPTATQPLPGSQGPPPPQPGAFPVPPGGGPPTATATSTSTALPPPVSYPPQMHIPPPSAAASAGVQAAQRGTSTAPFVAAPSPMEHPPGYQQNVHAGEMDHYQRARQDALEAEERSRSGTLGGGDGAVGEGVWDSAKKALVAAGGKLADAENEVWKRISKG